MCTHTGQTLWKFKYYLLCFCGQERAKVSLYVNTVKTNIFLIVLNFPFWTQQFPLVHFSTIRGHHSTGHAHTHPGRQRGSPGTRSSPASVLSHRWRRQFTVTWSSAHSHPAHDLLCSSSDAETLHVELKLYVHPSVTQTEADRSLKRGGRTKGDTMKGHFVAKTDTFLRTFKVWDNCI